MLFCLCKFMWIIDLLISRPSPHLRALTRPLPLKVLQIREQTPNPSLGIFIFKLTFEYFKECGAPLSSLLVHPCHQKVNRILLTCLLKPIYLPICLFPPMYQMATKPLNIKNILSNTSNRGIHKSLHYKLKNFYFHRVILSCNDI